MFTRLLTSGLIAGTAAGLIAALLQLAFVQPVLLHAELYESGALVHFATDTPSPVSPELPGFDPLRDLLSVLFTMLVYAGYGLMLAALMSMAAERGTRISPKAGLVWGVAGFVTVHLAPGFSLPPEVPGVAAADVAARQVWWFATVAATGAGLWLVAFGQSWLAWGAAAVLILLPHVIGAPQPAAFTGPVPPELSALYAARAFGVGLAAWALLGFFAAWLWSVDERGPQ